MDWIRRNWPDLLIGVALVAVIAMIVATLLSGGSLTSLLQRNTPPNITSTTGPASGPTGSTASPGTASGTPTSGAAATNTTGTTNPNSGAAGTNSAQDGNLDVFVPGVPGEAGAAAQNGAATPGSAAGNTAATTSSTTPGTAQPGSAATGPAASVNAPLPESVPNGGFRVAAGAVDSRDGALSAAQTFRDAGYTVTVEQQSDLYLLWIGPYASDAGAERVAARLIADDVVPDALVYTYDQNEAAANNAASNADNTPASGNGNNNNAATNAASSGANTAATNTGAANTGATNAGTTSTDTTNTGATNAGAAADTATTASPATSSDLSAPAGQQFLQVGAFRSDDSAVPQRQQLEQLGLEVTSNKDDNGIVRLYVGPFAGVQLAQTQSRLDNQGIDSFPVTP